jgi:hypothetical protein
MAKTAPVVPATIASISASEPRPPVNIIALNKSIACAAINCHMVVACILMPRSIKNKMRASSNPPSVLDGIPLSGQPELVQDFVLCLALLHPGRQFHSSIRNLRLFAITV